MNVEDKCIAKTCEYASKQTRDESKLYTDILNPFGNPFSGIIKDFTWESCLIGKIKQCLLLPLIIPLFVVFVLALPFALSADYFLRIKRRRLNSKRKAKTITKNTPYVVKSPIEKTVYSLWVENPSIFGRLNSFDKLDLLCEWVDILYGEHTSNKLKLRRRGLKIHEEQLKVQKLLSMESNDSYCSHSLLSFISTSGAEILAKELHAELPYYDLRFS